MTNRNAPLWRLVEICARELTINGLTPFARSELIRCVQTKRPGCGPDSINPIIQGVTDNLRGGAPGAVGKNILHSVARGQFILRQSQMPGAEPVNVAEKLSFLKIGPR